MTVLPLWRRGRRVAPLTDTAPPPRDVVVLSGGGSLGAAQVGALQALFEAGISPGAVIGCSVGAINAAYVAMNPTMSQVVSLEQVWRSMSRAEVFPGGRWTVARRLLARTNHLYSPLGMRSLLDACLPLRDLADTAIPCHVVTTDLLQGEPAWWTSGNPIDVLAASACLPGLFPPVELNGSLHVDGGVSCPVPTQRALDLGAERVWVLDVGRTFHGWADSRMSALDVLVESFAISRRRLAQQAPVVGAGQRVITLPPLTAIGRHDMRDFSKTSLLIRVGREAGRAMVAAERTPKPRLVGEPGSAVTPHLEAVR